jgi:catechol 2,3-dioxygenase-like lactoylglutathione lyase family enzyme
MARFERFVPVLKVRDLQESIDYYTRHFGFALRWRADNDGGGENCLMELDSLALLFSTGSHLGGDPQFTGTLYVHMEDVESIYEKVKDSVLLAWPLEIMEYGQKEFGVRDCNGYCLAFAEEI